MTSLIEVLGEELSKYLNIKPIQAKGLLRLSIKEMMPEKSIDELSLTNLTDVFNQSLKGRLDKIGISESNNIVKKLVNFTSKNQSLITILRT